MHPPGASSEPSHRRCVQWHRRIGGGERSEPVSRMVILPYDTESQSRNVLASPLGEEGHEVAKGWTVVRSKNDIGRRLAVRTAMEHPIGALPCTPFASSRRSPQGETRSMERKNRESYISCTIPQFPPLVVNAVSQSAEWLFCHMTLKVNPVTLTL